VVRPPSRVSGVTMKRYQDAFNDGNLGSCSEAALGFASGRR